MKINHAQDPLFGAQDRVRYVCHANGIVQCPHGDALSDRAFAEWRRDPDTRRLQMHWRVSHALPSACYQSAHVKAS
jgi:hypothetical protein